MEPSKWSDANERLRALATRMIKEGVDAPIFSSRFFGPTGELGALGKTRAQREQIVQSKLHRWLKERNEELRLRDASDNASQLSDAAS